MGVGSLVLMLKVSRSCLMPGWIVDSSTVRAAEQRLPLWAHSHTMNNQLETEPGKGNPTVQLKQSIAMVLRGVDTM